MTTAKITTKFIRGYIADPYWPQRAELIDIQKQSGMNRAKSEANRGKALEEWLKRNGKTLDWYKALEKRAAEPFHHGDDGTIIIPELHVYGMLVAANDEARSATRCCAPEQVRARFQVTPWRTSKRKLDGVWERFAMVSSGTGQKLSNQRGLRRSSYISEFEASGEISFSPEYVKPEALRGLLEYAGENIGIGASRKMGWGRFTVAGFIIS
jgi:hypothetical protein